MRNAITGSLITVVALALMFRWGMRSGRLRRIHGAPPAGPIRWILEIVTVSYLIAGGVLIWWVLADVIEPRGPLLVAALGASVLAFELGRRLEPRLTARLPRRSLEESPDDA